MSVNLGYPVFKAFTPAGLPAAGYKVYSYAAGSSTPQVTYTTAALTVANPNPTILDANGEAQIWLGNSLYKIVLVSDLGVTMWTMDNISGVVPTSGGGGPVGPVFTDLAAFGASAAMVNGTDVLIAIAASGGDTLGEVAAGKFTANQSGYYYITGVASMLSNVSADISTGAPPVYRLYKNGALLLAFATPNWPYPPNVTKQGYVPTQAGVALNAGDTLQFYINATFTGTPPNANYPSINIRRLA